MIIEKWKQSQIYVTGKDHSKTNVVCQDRTYCASKDGVHVIALADGAGSKKCSEIGASIVTKKISELLTRDFFKLYMHFERNGKEQEEYLEEIKVLKKQILHTLLQELLLKAEMENIPVYELASTLLFCALYKNQYIIGHIGDGVIGGLFEEDNQLVVRALSEPENGGAPNITFFVTDPNSLDHLRVSTGKFTNLRGIILMSDGPGEVMYHKSTGLHDNVIRIFENFHKKRSQDYNKLLHKFLTDKIAEFSSDDLSLNLLYLERIYANQTDEYTLEVLKDVAFKNQIVFKSQYCIQIDPTLTQKIKDFSSIDEVRSYIKWI